MNKRTALLVGASGLIGGHCLRELLSEDVYEKVTILVRRELPVKNSKLVQRIVDFDTLPSLDDFPQADDCFCSLGTTIKNAGSQESFYRVDFTYVNELATLASKHGARQFLMISSLGADAGSRVFYNRVKGEIEEAVKKLPFRGTAIFRPSILRGDRTESRPGERIAGAVMSGLSFLMLGPLRRYRPIHAARVARAIVNVARMDLQGVNVFESDSIEENALQ